MPKSYDVLSESTDDTLVIVREFAAPRELVFQAWTEPERFVQWWGPNGFTTPHCSIDLRIGGKLHFCMRSPEGQDIWVGGVIQELDPPARLVYTDYFADEQGNPVSPAAYGLGAEFPEEALVRLTLEDLEGGRTRLTLEHTVPITSPGREGAGESWGQIFDRLAAYLAG